MEQEVKSKQLRVQRLETQEEAAKLEVRGCVFLRVCRCFCVWVLVYMLVGGWVYV